MLWVCSWRGSVMRKARPSRSGRPRPCFWYHCSMVMWCWNITYPLGVLISSCIKWVTVMITGEKHSVNNKYWFLSTLPLDQYLKHQHHLWKSREQPDPWDSGEGKKKKTEHLRCGAGMLDPRTPYFRYIKNHELMVLEALKFCGISVFDKSLWFFYLTKCSSAYYF